MFFHGSTFMETCPLLQAVRAYCMYTAALGTIPTRFLFLRPDPTRPDPPNQCLLKARTNRRHVHATRKGVRVCALWMLACVVLCALDNCHYYCLRARVHVRLIVPTRPVSYQKRRSPTSCRRSMRFTSLIPGREKWGLSLVVCSWCAGVAPVVVPGYVRVVLFGSCVSGQSGRGGTAAGEGVS